MANTIVLSEALYEELHSGLFASELETAAFILAAPVRVNGAWRLVARAIVPVHDREYTHRSSVAIELPPIVLANVVKRARLAGLSIVFVHTHPSEGAVEPSAADRTGESRFLPLAFGRIPNVPHARLIIGRTGLHASVFDSTHAEHPAEVVRVGRGVRILNRDDSHLAPVTATSLAERFDRQVHALGTEGQQRLANLRVAIVGLGGTGSVVAQQLAYLGVRNFSLMDPDVIEHSNLNRLVSAGINEVGRPKVDAACALVQRIAPSARVEARTTNVVDVSSARTLLMADFVVCCTDSHGSRYVINQMAYQFELPAIDLGVRIDAELGVITRATGRVQMLAPGLPCLVCSSLLDPEIVRRDLLSDASRQLDPYIVGAPTPQPAVVSLNSTVASLAVTMLLGAVTGAPFGARHQIVRFDTGSVRSIGGASSPTCPVCSPDAALARGDTWPMPGRGRWLGA